MRKRQIVIGLLGPTLDEGRGPKRWMEWRPTVAVCQQEDFIVDQFIILFQTRYRKLFDIVSEDIHSISPETEIVGREIEFEDPWDFEDVYGTLHDFARSMTFNPETEDYLIHITTGTHVAQICLFLLTEARYFPGRLLQAHPPRKRDDNFPGTLNIIDLDLSKYDRLASRFRREHKEGLSFLKSGIETRNAQFNRLIEEIERVAIHSRAPILLMGPTGAGKSQLARRIYELKRARRQMDGPLVEVNCATIRGDGAMAALFGHTKGAFTGALTPRPGLLRASNGGILFLDEIGELGVDEQAMLLRAVEEKVFLPVGSDREVESDFQLIAGTNRDLSKEVREGRFREDLFARINLWTYRLPGLQERREDIEPNLDYELDQFAQKTGTRVTFNKEARRRLLEFALSPQSIWRANFRDLNAAVTRMATLAPGGRINLEGVEGEIARLELLWKTPSISGISSGQDDLQLQNILGPEKAATLDPFDRVQLSYVVSICRRSRTLSEAGRQLFSISRLEKKNANDADRLRKYLAKFGLDWNSLNEAVTEA